MSDAERLGKIDVVHYEEDEDGNHFALLKEDDYWFLKEQAERMQELEKANKKNYWIASDFKYENLVLEQQNKRYHKALVVAFEELTTILEVENLTKEQIAECAGCAHNKIFEALEDSK